MLIASPYGSWTHENKDSGRGVEPDECYVFGEPRNPERCDLAIEVIWTSGGLDKLEVYRFLNVPEVWIWKDARMQMFGLVGERYEPLQQSQFVPGLKLEQRLPFIEVVPMTRAVREYRAALKRG